MRCLRRVYGVKIASQIILKNSNIHMLVKEKDPTKETEIDLPERLQETRKVWCRWSQGDSVFRKKYPPVLTAQFLQFTFQFSGRNESKIFFIYWAFFVSSPLLLSLGKRKKCFTLLLFSRAPFTFYYCQLLPWLSSLLHHDQHDTWHVVSGRYQWQLNKWVTQSI